MGKGGSLQWAGRVVEVQQGESWRAVAIIQ